MTITHNHHIYGLAPAWAEQDFEPAGWTRLRLLEQVMAYNKPAWRTARVNSLSLAHALHPLVTMLLNKDGDLVWHDTPFGQQLTIDGGQLV